MACGTRWQALDRGHPGSWTEEKHVGNAGKDFNDPFDDLLKEARMSDAELERLMGSAGGAAQKSGGYEALDPGTRVRGVVVDVTRGEVLVELDGKTLGILEAAEFPGEERPAVGERIEASFERFDGSKGLAVLSLGRARREVLWEELRIGTVLEGTVSAVNKGGLTLDIRGARAFLPVSHVELTRVEDLGGYVGKKLSCEVTSFDPSTRNLVVSRRRILEREAEATRTTALARLGEGEVLRGTVKRVTEHGAFIDLGGVDGLLPERRMQEHLKLKNLTAPLAEGQEVEVEIVRMDRERGRITLDFKLMDAQAWGRAIEGYSAGDVVTGWVSRRDQDGVILSIDEGLEGILPAEYFHLLDEAPRPGSILKAAIATIDPARRRITLKPAR
jgi:ribosomal protein S1